jgi:hypothetical protein
MSSSYIGSHSNEESSEMGLTESADQRRLAAQNQCLNILMIVRILLTYLEKVERCEEGNSGTSLLLRAKAVSLHWTE